MIGQAYPWDLVDHPGRAAQWREGGVDELAIASSYHAVRALSWRPDGSVAVIQQQRSAHYLPGSDRWVGRALRPRPPVGLPHNLFPRSVDTAREAGLGVRAWVVLTHADHEAGSPEAAFSTVDLFGNRSRFALCPSNAEVREYARGLLVDVLNQTGVDRFLIESLQPLGFRHLVAHDKSPFSALDDSAIDLLSVCFCTACEQDARQRGIDLAAAGAVLRAAFARGRARGGGRPGAAATADEVAAVLVQLDELRRSASTRFLSELAEPEGGQPLDLTLAATAHQQTFGPFASVTSADAQPGGASGFCAELSAPGGAGWADAQTFAEWGAARVAGTLNLTRSGATVREALADSHPTGTPPIGALDELFLYHLGAQRPADFDTLGLAELPGARTRSIPTETEPDR
ncbi:hypothetical protein B7R25_05105 [Subtercola boreus]|uniref:Uncharacterized protein n=2 Tax=Subtercola boreus TaxID=120213 RepID=A0A3E0WCG8_9MICO|nr:hypothetical protein B7R24_05035 [Subtercola boreus]RFA22234.1 hypothetical protein B7R23_04980 [Subtercola boreus]RFA28097.1 hypothetical protein B7R25_05105 [Subtercola boreus]